MRTVAERLGGAAAAGAPPIGLAGFDLDLERPLLCDHPLVHVRPNSRPIHPRLPAGPMPAGVTSGRCSDKGKRAGRRPRSETPLCCSAQSPYTHFVQIGLRMALDRAGARAGGGSHLAGRRPAGRARSRHQQLPAVGRRADAGTASTSSTASRASCASARAWLPAAGSSEPAMPRTLAALKICPADHGPAPGGAGPLRRHRGLPPGRATARISSVACRRVTGIDLEVLGSDEEARLAMLGCLPLIDPDSRPAPDARYRRRQHRDHVARSARARGWPRARPHALDAAGRRHAVGKLRRGATADRLRPDGGVTWSTSWPMPTGCPPRPARSSGPRLQMLGTSGTVTTLAPSIWACAATTAARSTACRCRFRGDPPCVADAARLDDAGARPTPASASTAPTSCRRLRDPRRGPSLLAGRAAPGRRPRAARRHPQRAAWASPGPGPAARGCLRCDRRAALTTRLKTARGRSASSQRWLHAPAQRPFRPSGAPAGLARTVGVQAAGARRALRSARGRGARVIDLGAAPGSWTPVCGQARLSRGRRRPAAHRARRRRATCCEGDFLDPAVQDRAASGSAGPPTSCSATWPLRPPASAPSTGCGPRGWARACSSSRPRRWSRAAHA